MSSSLRVLTFNIRNTTDRYSERKELLRSTVEGCNADVIGLQEVCFEGEEAQHVYLSGEKQYNSWLARTQVTLRPAEATEDLTFRIDGVAMLTRAHSVAPDNHEVEHLSDVRPAQRILVPRPGSARPWLICNVHLHHIVGDEGDRIRLEQVSHLLDWIDTCSVETGAQVLMGDFNAIPGSPAYNECVRRGYQSAFKSVHGKEPEITFPSGLQAPTMDTSDPCTLDYMFIRGAAKAVTAELVGATPLDSDSTIYPSDHLGVVVNLEDA